MRRLQKSAHRLRAAPAAACVLIPAFVAACQDDRAPDAPAAPSSPSAEATAAATAAPAPAIAKKPAHVREGSSIARAVGRDVLVVADEDAHRLVELPLDLDPNKAIASTPLPGPPAQVIALDGRLLVTVRAESTGASQNTGAADRASGAGDSAPSAEPSAGLRAPGSLLIVGPEGQDKKRAIDSIDLPADAWGIAITPDEKVALVTSAWTHKVSAVDIEQKKVLWSVDVGREPRGVVITGSGKTAYITHLVRASLTRIDDITGEPKVRVVPFPAAPTRTNADRAEAATLGYSPVLSPDGSRLYVARQALGAMGVFSWAGQSTVDILLMADETPLAARPKRWYAMRAPDFLRTWELDMPFSYALTGPVPAQHVQAFVQPRAVVYRSATDTLLVASEGTDALVELDALSVDPSMSALQTYAIGELPAERDKPDTVGKTRCGAPSGVALSADERSAFVLCRSSRHVVEVKLDPLDPARPYKLSFGGRAELSADPLDEKAALGRKLFHNAYDHEMSDGFACAGCHPEGRDDGHVWHEDIPQTEGGWRNMHAFDVEDKFDGLRKGTPRQTPMLAARVDAFGPYGWKAESKTLRHRVVSGFTLHRWSGGAWGDTLNQRAEAIVEYLRKGMAKPPREERDLTADEQRGKQLFDDPNVGCATCHVPKTGYTNRAKVGLGAWALDKKKFEPEQGDDWLFKTPSLLYVGGTPPYFHDGSEATLEGLIDHNGTRMGHTKQLSAADRAALVAFLKML